MNLEPALWNVLNFLMTAFFAAAVGVQYGHPTSVLGMVIYGAAGIACVLTIRNTEIKLLPPVVGVIALAWALTFAPDVVGKVRLDEVFRLSEMERNGVGAAREIVGLLMVTVWMVVLTIASPYGRAAKARKIDRR